MARPRRRPSVCACGCTEMMTYAAPGRYGEVRGVRHLCVHCYRARQHRGERVGTRIEIDYGRGFVRRYHPDKGVQHVSFATLRAGRPSDKMIAFWQWRGYVVVARTKGKGRWKRVEPQSG